MHSQRQKEVRTFHSLSGVRTFHLYCTFDVPHAPTLLRSKRVTLIQVSLVHYVQYGRRRSTHRSEASFGFTLYGGTISKTQCILRIHKRSVLPLFAKGFCAQGRQRCNTYSLHLITSETSVGVRRFACVFGVCIAS